MTRIDVWHFFSGIRRLVVFLLGIWVIIDGLTESTNVVPKLIVGMIMVGVLPIESFQLVRPHKQSIDAMHIRDVESN